MRGKPARDAESILMDKDFGYRIVQERPGEDQPGAPRKTGTVGPTLKSTGTVVAEHPHAGALVPPQTTVRLLVRRG